MSRASRLWARTGAALALTWPLLACGGSGAATCLGWVEDDQGARHSPEEGTADGERAQRLACNAYCRDADPGYDAMYQVWRDSPAGDPSVTKAEAIFRDEALMRYVTETCADRCLSEIASGARRGGVDCEDGR